MADFTERFSEIYFVQVGLHSANRAAGVYQTPWLDMSTYHRAAFLLDVGTMAAGSTVDMIIQEATSNAGAGVQAIAGKAITQLTQAGGDGDDWVIIELRSEEMDENNAYRFVRAQVTVAAAASQISLWTLGGGVDRYPPVPTTNVTEIVD